MIFRRCLIRWCIGDSFQLCCVFFGISRAVAFKRLDVRFLCRVDKRSLKRACTRTGSVPFMLTVVPSQNSRQSSTVEIKRDLKNIYGLSGILCGRLSNIVLAGVFWRCWKCMLQAINLLTSEKFASQDLVQATAGYGPWFSLMDRCAHSSPYPATSSKSLLVTLLFGFCIES